MKFLSPTQSFAEKRAGWECIDPWRIPQNTLSDILQSRQYGFDNVPLKPDPVFYRSFSHCSYTPSSIVGLFQYLVSGWSYRLHRAGPQYDRALLQNRPGIRDRKTSVIPSYLSRRRRNYRKALRQAVANVFQYWLCLRVPQIIEPFMIWFMAILILKHNTKKSASWIMTKNGWHSWGGGRRRGTRGFHWRLWHDI